MPLNPPPLIVRRWLDSSLLSFRKVALLTAVSNSIPIVSSFFSFIFFVPLDFVSPDATFELDAAGYGEKRDVKATKWAVHRVEALEVNPPIFLLHGLQLASTIPQGENAI